MGDWAHTGAYRVLPRAARRARPVPGEIIRHAMPDGTPSDSYRLRCPICNAVIPVWARQIGDLDAPTFDRPLRCGCRERCGRAFRIRAGRAEACDAEPEGLRREPLSPELEAAGVTYGPRPRRRD